MKKLISVLVVIVMLCSLGGCALFKNEIVPIDESEAAPYLSMAQEFINALFEEDYIACHALFGESLAGMKDRAQLQEEWEQMRLLYGDPVGVDRYEAYRVNGEGSIVAQVAQTHGGCSIQMIYDKNNELVAIWFGMREDRAAYSIEAPDGVVETELVLGAGTDYPLRAILSMPEGAENAPCVVLVHDAGASDLNSALGGCVPFADLAHGLALQGVATLRYDKRTFAHADSFTEEQVMSMTVQEEVIEDALLAIDTAAAAQGVSSVWIAGHGLGGMLAPRIAVESGGKVSGIISMGSTARGYLEVVYEQNLAMTADAERKNAIKREYKKVEKLEDLKDDATVFGLPVPYLKDLYENPVEAQLDKLDLPVLVLHGKNDFQFSLDDYKSWQTALDNYAGKYEMVLYDDLNHLFADNTSLKRRGTAAEYLVEAKVSQNVIDRIAEWVTEP